MSPNEYCTEAQNVFCTFSVQDCAEMRHFINVTRNGDEMRETIVPFVLKYSSVTRNGDEM